VNGSEEPGHRVVIINGGSRGIGRSTAFRLGLSDWRVCVTGRRAPALAEVHRELERAGVEVMSVQGAAEDGAHQEDTIDRVIARWGRIDALVNNAAASPYFGPLVDAQPDHFRRAWEVNVVAAWRWTSLAYHRYMAEHGGSVVNVASIGGTYPVPMVGVYNLSKAALIHLTKQLARELAPGVRVNAVAPATIRTDFAKAKLDGREADVAKQYPLERLGEPEEVADIIAMLCEGRLAWITGQVIVLDGGATLVQGIT
jgi:3-oxoacyl-[acyl-carrier protein] reductase